MTLEEGKRRLEIKAEGVWNRINGHLKMLLDVLKEMTACLSWIKLEDDWDHWIGSIVIS